MKTGSNEVTNDVRISLLIQPVPELILLQNLIQNNQVLNTLSDQNVLILTSKNNQAQVLTKLENLPLSLDHLVK